MSKSAAHRYPHVEPPHDDEPPRYDETPPPRARHRRRRRPTPRQLAWWGLGLILLFVLLSVIAILFIDEPLRRYMEREMNASLKGYTVRIHKLDFHPLGFGVDLEDLTVTQNAHPKPPVADFPRLAASVQWRALIYGRLVANVRFDHPRIHVNRAHLAAEAKDKTPVSQHGWQQALEKVYPLKINEFVVNDGEVTYIDKDPKRPLTIKNLDFEAENVRNIRSRERTYPSEIHLTGTVFDTGKLRMDGNADFLAEPYAGVKAAIDVENTGLDYFAPVVDEYNVAIKKGTLSAQGDIEYSPKVKTGALRDVTLKTLVLEYANRPGKKAAVIEATEKTTEAAKSVSNDPGILLKIDRLRMLDSYLGYVNEDAEPHYRLYLADTDVTLQNLSNQEKRGTATAELKGKFMGSGATTASATFRPEKNGRDFDLKLEIRDTDLRGLNELLQAYGNFDVARGAFSLDLDLHVKGDRAEGFVKPFFRDMKVYDARQDAEKDLFHKTYEMLVGGVAGLLENAPRGEVATKTDLKGSASNPRTSTWQIVVNLLKNAFFKAILPGFDAEVTKQKTE